MGADVSMDVSECGETEVVVEFGSFEAAVAVRLGGTGCELMLSYEQAEALYTELAPYFAAESYVASPIFWICRIMKAKTAKCAGEGGER